MGKPMDGRKVNSGSDNGTRRDRACSELDQAGSLLKSSARQHIIYPMPTSKPKVPPPPLCAAKRPAHSSFLVVFAAVFSASLMDLASV